MSGANGLPGINDFFRHEAHAKGLQDVRVTMAGRPRARIRAPRRPDMTLEALGWTEQRQTEFAVHGAVGLVPGRVVAEHRSHYRVATDSIELTAGTTGRIRNTAVQRSDLPGVGDFVAVRLAEGDGPATIEVV